MADITRLVKRYNELKAQHYNWEPDWQDIADFILPFKNDITTKNTPGTPIARRLYDSTAVHANNLLAASLQGSLTNEATRWFSLKMRNPELNEDHAVQEWNEKCTSAILAAFSDSNFYSEIAETYKDLGAFGTGCLLSEESDLKDEGFNGLRFRSHNVGEYVVAENDDGRVDTVFRKFQMTAENIVAKFEKGSDDVMKAMEDKPDNKYWVVHAVYPNKDYKGGKNDKPYHSCYFEWKSKRQLAEGGFFEFPFLVPRWDKNSGDVYGRSPGHVVLPDVRVINKVIEYDLKYLGKVIDPPIAVQDDGVIGTANLYASGVTTLRDMNALKTLNITRDGSAVQVKIEQLQQSIKQAYYSDQLQLQQGPQMTAHEVMVRYELMQRLLGPTLNRLTAELLNPLIIRVFNIMLRTDALPEAPPLIQQEIAEGRGYYDIKYESPLARAQRSSELQAFQNWLGLMGPIAATNPDVMDLIDFDAASRHLADVVGIPESILRGQEEVDALRQARAAAMQDAAGQQQQSQMMQDMGAMAPMVKATKDMEMPEGGIPGMGVGAPPEETGE